jgi:hypothetical protein
MFRPSTTAQVSAETGGAGLSGTRQACRRDGKSKGEMTFEEG